MEKLTVLISVDVTLDRVRVDIQVEALGKLWSHQVNVPEGLVKLRASGIRSAEKQEPSPRDERLRHQRVEATAGSLHMRTPF